MITYQVLHGVERHKKEDNVSRHRPLKISNIWEKNYQ